MYRIILLGLLIWIKVTVASGQIMIVKPYLQDITQSEAIIMFETNVATPAKIIYGLSPFTLLYTQDATAQIGNGATRIISATLTDLQSGEKYYYKIVLGDDIQSGLYHFITLQDVSEEQAINFVAVSDMQMQPSKPTIFSDLINLGIIPTVNNEIEGGIDNLHGMIIPGDLVQTGGNYNEWKNTFFIPAENLTPYVPLYPVPGNHEYYGGGLPNFVKYFDLPDNGNSNFPDEWWYKDFSNVRVIGLNSNTPSAQLNDQLVWLQYVVDQTCTIDEIDFVFVQLHHPYKSEMWTPGELPFTGEVAGILENFTTTCGKPSIHFFGHTHGYSRGQSKNHQHLWVNVAVAGGAIDYWGQYPNQDYEEFSHSDDDYGFVLVQSTAGPDPEINLKRYSRGDDNVVLANVLQDKITLKKNGNKPHNPVAIWPTGIIPTNCVTLKASTYDGNGAFHQASQWQVSSDENFTSIVKDSWRQHENLYQGIDLQANDDLTDEEIIGLQDNQVYYWRVRYRNEHLFWSDWSNVQSFQTGLTSISPNLLLNNNAETGVSQWAGDIESLTNNECNSVPVYEGLRFFGVGGICANEQNVGIATQIIGVEDYANDIDNNLLSVQYSGYLRTYSVNNDRPEIAVEFFNSANQSLGVAPYLVNTNPSWMLLTNTVTIPVGTRHIQFILKGTRLAGSDNDSYFDVLYCGIVNNQSCITCAGNSGLDNDQDGFCSDLDCNDNDASIYPYALELCDGKDNNCDGQIEFGQIVNWTGLGNGYEWEDNRNWDQKMVPLPCQHVVINATDTVEISTNPVVRSMEIKSSSILKVKNNASLGINTENNPNFNSLHIIGELINYGRVDLQNSITDGIHLSGKLYNYGRMYINNVSTYEFEGLPNGLLDNQGLIKIRN